MIELYYWPGIQGRGELIRLALEDSATPYVDVARGPEGMAALRAMMSVESAGDGPVPFAPPIVRDGDLVLAQTANILHYLGARVGLAPDDERGRLRAHQLQLTIADFFDEVHDTHHPIGSSLYYEDQKPEAAKRTQAFLRERMPKFLGYFEREIARHDDPCSLGRHSYVDLSLFQVIEGLRYAFPRAMAAFEPSIPRLVALRDRVSARPNVALYLQSPRRLPFSEHGIFRRYPELDVGG